MNIKGIPLIRIIYYFGLGLMVVALPLSEYFMSVAQFILTIVFMWEGIDYKPIHDVQSNHKRSLGILLIIPTVVIEVLKNIASKFILFYRNKPALILSSIYLLHIIGLLHTSDIAQAMQDLRIKLPLFLLPLFISTTEGLGKKGFYRLLGLYVAAVFVATLISTWVYLSRDIIDPRDISIYISHIRFSLNICLAIFILWYFIIYKDTFKISFKAGFVVTLLWLLLFMIILRSRTGFLALALSGAYVIVRYVIAQKTPIRRYGTLFISLAIPIAILSFIFITVKNYVDVEEIHIEELEQYTQNGTRYTHDVDMGIEAGRHLGIYICYPELEQSWNTRSNLDFNGRDKKGQELRYTLIRFLTSKDYRKDTQGVAQLTDEEVVYIENGIANVNYLNRYSIKNSINQIILAYLDYRRYGNTAGYSAFERIEQLKAASSIIRNNFLIGVGTGDLHDVFKTEFTQIDSNLKDSDPNMFSSHNQFFNILIMFGIIGLAWFLFALIYPPVKTGLFKDYFFMVFFVIMIVSMLLDDTLNTQPGSTFVYFFFSLFLFGRKKEALAIED